MIKTFEGIYHFLSNFYISPVNYEGVNYPSSEHAYQAAKTLNLSERKQFQNPNMTPGQAKKAGRALTIRKDWENIKVSVMETILESKFTNKELAKWLIETGDHELQEGNYWNDKF